MIRPFGPDAVTADRSTPSSRAIRRTLGPGVRAGRRLVGVRVWTPRGGAASGAPTASATGFAAAGPRRGLLLLHQRRRSGHGAVPGREEQDR